jgi:hypothetical protein
MDLSKGFFDLGSKMLIGNKIFEFSSLKGKKAILIVNVASQ